MTNIESWEKYGRFHIPTLFNTQEGWVIDVSFSKTRGINYVVIEFDKDYAHFQTVTTAGFYCKIGTIPTFQSPLETNLGKSLYK